MRNYSFFYQENLTSVTLMCLNIPYWQFYFCSDIFKCETKKYKLKTFLFSGKSPHLEIN